MRAAAVGSQFKVDNTKLAQAEKLIGQIRKRLDIAERVLAHEARFTEAIPVDTITEADLLTQVREHFEQRTAEDDELLAANDAEQREIRNTNLEIRNKYE